MGWVSDAMRQKRKAISKSEIWDLFGELSREGLARLEAEDLLDRKVTSGRLVRAYRSLKPDLRETLYLRLCGYTQHDIAAQLGITQQAVSRRLRKAQQQLRAVVAGSRST